MQNMESVFWQSEHGYTIPFQCIAIGAEEFEVRGANFGKCDFETWTTKAAPNIDMNRVIFAAMFAGAFESRKMGRALLSVDATEGDGLLTVKLVFKPLGK